jgi:hypothetical protein
MDLAFNIRELFSKDALNNMFRKALTRLLTETIAR